VKPLHCSVSCWRQFPRLDRRVIHQLDISDYLADSVDAFLTYESPDVIEGEDLPLGLTFSFPVEQSALDSGHLLTWTKGASHTPATPQSIFDDYPIMSGFSAKNAVGHDVVKLLQDAFHRKHLHVKCVALVNDVGV
jgi:hexokinase